MSASPACEHDYVYEGEVRFRENHGSDPWNGIFVFRFVVEKTYFCRKCLDRQTKRQEDTGSQVPDWYKR